jgi:hypothetical protein
VVGPQALALLGAATRLGGAAAALLGEGSDPGLSGSPLEYDAITATYRITEGVVSTRDLLYTSRALTIAATGDYTLATGRLAFDLAIRQGRHEVGARVTGTAAAPSVRVTRLPASLVRGGEAATERALGDLLRRLR